MISIFNGILGRQKSAKDNELCQVARVNGKYTLVGTGVAVADGTKVEDFEQIKDFPQGSYITITLDEQELSGRVYHSFTPNGSYDITLYTDTYNGDTQPPEYQGVSVADGNISYFGYTPYTML